MVRYFRTLQNINIASYALTVNTHTKFFPKRIFYKQPVGKDVFIGSQSVVNQGVAITDGVVVGSLTCVNKPIVEKGVYVGNPAKRIK